jgi:hypothetical protein
VAVARDCKLVVFLWIPPNPRSKFPKTFAHTKKIVFLVTTVSKSVLTNLIIPKNVRYSLKKKKNLA